MPRAQTPRHRPSPWLPAALLLLLLPGLEAGGAGTGAATLYRWTDAQGNIHYTDAIPPSASEQRRARLNKHGIETEQIDPVKSKEELIRQEELERLRAEQERLKQEQAKEDALLLNLYSSEEEIRMAKDGKIAALDGINEITRLNIQRLKVHLEKMQKDAADAERSGRGVPKTLLDRIESARQQIKQSFESLIEREQQKVEITEKFQANLQRYLTLKKLDLPEPEHNQASEKPSVLETVVQCADEASCDTAWARAETYVRQHTTTRMQMLGKNIIVTAPPVQHEDISLAVSRIEKPGRSGARLFLDVQCKDSPLGKTFCESDRVEAIRSGFKAFLAPQAAPPATQPAAATGSNSTADTAGH